MHGASVVVELFKSVAQKDRQRLLRAEATLAMSYISYVLFNYTQCLYVMQRFPSA